MQSTRTLFILLVISLLQTYSFSQTVVEVPATSDWVPTGIIRSATDEVKFCAGGEVRGWPLVNPECWRWVTPSGIGRPNFISASAPCYNCPVLSLIGKIGPNGVPFFIGERAVLEPSVINAEGEIFLRINDVTINDNIGSWQVAISVDCEDLSDCFDLPDPSLGTVQVPGSSDWISTGIIRGAGEQYIICSRGEIIAWDTTLSDCWRTVTPSGLGRYNFVNNNSPCPACPVLSLIAKIGLNSTPFYVGDRGIIQSTEPGSGEIFLKINDASLSDNSGEWTVSVVKDCSEISDCFAQQIVSTTPLPAERMRSSVVAISPNPATDHINITLQTDKAGDCEIRMYDISGKLVKNTFFTLNTGIQTVEVSLPYVQQTQIFAVQTMINGHVYNNMIVKE